MKMTSKILSSVFATVALIASAQAGGLTHEVNGGATAFVNLGIASGSTTTTLGVSGAYFYSLDRNIQIGLRDTFAWNSTTEAASNLVLAVGGISLMGSDLRDDMFLRVGVGATIASSSYFAFSGEIGKRFALSDSVSFVPYVMSVTNLDVGTDLSIVPLSFSVFF